MGVSDMHSQLPPDEPTPVTLPHAVAIAELERTLKAKKAAREATATHEGKLQEMREELMTQYRSLDEEIAQIEVSLALLRGA